MTLADKEWLSTRDVSRVLGWSQNAIRHRIRDKFFINTRHERNQYFVHRDEIIKLISTGGKHGTKE